MNIAVAAALLCVTSDWLCMHSAYSFAHLRVVTVASLVVSVGFLCDSRAAIHSFLRFVPASEQPKKDVTLAAFKHKAV